MSREFGSYSGGYFHTQMQYAADDCLSGKDEITRLWGKFFDEFKEIAYAIASSEASDSSADYPIFETIKRIDTIKKRIEEIENYCYVFDQVAKKAVQNYIEENKK